MSEWGKDHWSTFAYLETRAVDHKGYIDSRHMRGGFYTKLGEEDKYPTRLRGYDGTDPSRLSGVMRRGGYAETRLVFNHDDYDCVDDMIAEGLVEPHPDTVSTSGRVAWHEINNRRYRDSKGRFKHENWRARYENHRFILTDKGHVVAGQLRAHKANGGNFARFVPDLTEVAA
jgi:hypothetical protein